MNDGKLAEIRARHDKFEALRFKKGDYMNLAVALLNSCRLWEAAVDDREWLLDEVERQARHIEELQSKVDAEKSCACSYDAPGDVCAAHSPALAAARAEVERLREENRILRASLKIDFEAALKRAEGDR